MKKVLIIAEAGVNHNGDLKIAKQLIDAASDSGADIVKFQTFKAENLVSMDARKADYQVINTKNSDTQFSMLKKLELNVNDHYELIEHCKSRSIRFLSTAFDLESIDLLVELGIDLFKIPSGEITNLPYLKKIAQLKKQVIISTGMCTIAEISDAVNIFIDGGTLADNITILHCNTEYPTPMKDVNLLAMNSIRDEFKVDVGYSDHTLGIEIPIAAVALGATVIEKHFTLDRSMEGPDHIASLIPVELKQMVNAIRNVEMALGSDVKQPSESELKNKIIARKSIHLAHALKKGHIITEGDLVMKRPGDGISPMQMFKIVGGVLKRDLPGDSKLEMGDLA